MSTTITAALVAAIGELEQPRKDSKANTGQYAYTYLSLPGLIEHVRPALKRHDLAAVQNVTTYDGWLQVETVILHSSGEDMRFGPLSFPLGADAQKSGSAISYLRRYALAAALGIAPEEDDDGAQATAKPRKNVGGSVPESVASGAPATTPEPKAGPSATSDEAGGLFVGDGNGAGAKALGEGADVPAPRAEYMSSKELSIWVKAMGGADAAKAAAGARYGERIRGVNDVTRDMALELVNAKAGAA